MQTVVNAVHKVTFGRPADRQIGGATGLLARLAPFTSTTKNFRAERRHPTRYCGEMGRLSDRQRERLWADNPIYVVFSYATPIAWVTEEGFPRFMDLSETDGGSTQTTKTHMSSVIVWLNRGQCVHGEPLGECMAAKAMIELKSGTGNPLPPDHGELWHDCPWFT